MNSSCSFCSSGIKIWEFLIIFHLFNIKCVEGLKPQKPQEHILSRVKKQFPFLYIQHSNSSQSFLHLITITCKSRAETVVGKIEVILIYTGRMDICSTWQAGRNSGEQYTRQISEKGYLFLFNHSTNFPMKLEFWNAWPDLCEPYYQGWNYHELLLYSLVEVLRDIKSPTGWPSGVVDLHYPRLKKYQYQHLNTADYYIKSAELNQRI